MKGFHPSKFVVSLLGIARRLIVGESSLSPWNPDWTRKQKGRWGERAAERFLWKEKGHRILGRNLIFRGGELDLVTDDQGEIVFVEVKTRLEPGRNPPMLAVDEVKMQRLRTAARQYLRRLRPPIPPARIDLVGVVPDPEGGEPHISHLPAVVRYPGGRADGVRKV